MNDFWTRVAAFIVGVMVFIGLVTIISNMQANERDDEMIPRPPVGYHYCTDEDATTLGFCRNTR